MHHFRKGMQQTTGTKMHKCLVGYFMKIRLYLKMINRNFLFYNLIHFCSKLLHYMYCSKVTVECSRAITHTN